MSGKREDCLTKIELYKLKETLLNTQMDDTSKYMILALIVSDRSKDPSNQVGAVIVNNKREILSLGYNGAPYGMNDDEFPWDSKGEESGDLMNIKNSFVVHAEANAIMNYLKSAGANSVLKNATMYVTWFPCNECAKLITQSGIGTVIYHRMYLKPELVQVTNKIFECAGIKCIPYSEALITKDIQSSQRECNIKRIKYINRK